MSNIDELKSTGLKATLPRLKILDVFQKSTQRHLTAEDVFRVLLEDRTDIGLATVYRVLTQFEQAGILSRSHFESGKAVYEINEGHHHDHLICTSCGRVEEFYDAEIEKRQQIVAKAKGWILQDHAMVFIWPVRDLRRQEVKPPTQRGLRKPGPRNWLCQAAGAAAPSGGRKLHEVSDRGGHVHSSCSIARRWRSTNS